MKKALYTIMLIILISSVGFSDKLFAQTKEEWSEWSGFECFKGIDYRIKFISVYQNRKDIYSLQLRNRYSESITLSWRICAIDDNDKQKADKRSSIAANSESSDSYESIDKGTKIKVVISKVSFNTYGSAPYYNCDK